MTTYLVITRTEDKLRVRVQVQDPLDDLALVDRNRANLQVLLADEDLNRALVREVVLEEVLALAALEQTVIHRRMSDTRSRVS